MAPVDEVLAFWFGKPDSREYGRSRKVWFAKDPEFDEAVRSHLFPLYQQAARGELDGWMSTPRGCLALIILLDQVPRNLFRDRPQAFATDAKALSVAETAVDNGFDREVLPVQRWFIYLPFEHSENLDHQERCLALFAHLEDDPQSAEPIDYARRHRDVIQRFGRFPHRNAILGRESTPEEVEFLKQPGSRF
ncbi:MAG: DUF924 family protein [Cyanobacteriota bacterium]|nr:DUF924 family protein [Cyanobacteriota bacterium]